jgi:hypothetical protein
LYLAIAVVTLGPLMALLAVFFGEACFQNSETCGALAFCVQARSPAARCIFRVLGRLENPDRRSWAMLRGVGGWDAGETTLALTSALATRAALWQRRVRPFLTWPCRGKSLLPRAWVHSTCAEGRPHRGPALARRCCPSPDPRRVGPGIQQQHSKRRPLRPRQEPQPDL